MIYRSTGSIKCSSLNDGIVLHLSKGVRQKQIFGEKVVFPDKVLSNTFCMLYIDSSTSVVKHKTTENTGKEPDFQYSFPSSPQLYNF